MFLEKFKSNIKELGLIKPESKILLTVSGGVDSMVMMYLFNRLELQCSVAHCNFQLRGIESDDDELFVRQQANLLNLQIFVAKLETEEYASEKHISIQMAARELRYSWFDKLAKAHNFEFIAIGHNNDDALETFFIHLSRGTGIAGLTGISSRTGNIIRPLLFASRSEIDQYAAENDIPYREDSSNISRKYLRNAIRHDLIPQFIKIFPNFKKTLSRTIDNINEAYQLYKESVEEYIISIVQNNGEFTFIDIPKLEQCSVPKTILFEIIKDYGFSSFSADEIYRSIHSISGKQFFSSTHKLIKDRNRFIITRYTEDSEIKVYIENDCISIQHPCNLMFEIMKRSKSTMLEYNSKIAQIDYEKLDFPLILRKWHHGDYFVPLGMRGMKKLSDFFIDRKFSLLEKQNTWILTSNGQIVWIVENRLDDRFKVTNKTRIIYKISIENNP